jgi:hypothetical protein
MGVWFIVNHVCLVWVVVIILCGSLLLMANMEDWLWWFGEKFLVMVEEAIKRSCSFGWGHFSNFGKS